MEKSSFKLEKQSFFEKFFSNKELKEYRIKAIRRTFLFLSLAFFLCYYFIGVSFYEEFFKQIISKIYFLFVIVGVILGIYLTREYIKNAFFKYFSIIFFIIIGIIAIFPIFIKKDFLLSLFN